VTDERERRRAEVSLEVKQLMRRARFTLLQWAQHAGVPHGSAKAWAAGLRLPEAENLEALAAGLERFAADTVPEIAAGLRRAARERRDA
jgi:hypothetical protein